MPSLKYVTKTSDFIKNNVIKIWLNFIFVLLSEAFLSYKLSI